MSLRSVKNWALRIREHVTLAYLVLYSLACFVWIDLGFRFLGFQRVFELFTNTPESRKLGDHSSFVCRVNQAVETAHCFYYRTRQDCLPRALVAYRLLVSRGVPCALQIGVKKYPFEGHAWVETANLIVDRHPGRVSKYTVLKQKTFGYTSK